MKTSLVLLKNPVNIIRLVLVILSAAVCAVSFGFTVYCLLESWRQGLIAVRVHQSFVASDASESLALILGGAAFSIIGTMTFLHMEYVISVMYFHLKEG